MKTLRRLLPRLLAFASLLIVSAGSLSAQLGPQISVTPTTLNFLQVQGGKFAMASFTIANTGDQTLTGTVETPGGVFQVVDGDGSFSIAPGGFEVVTLRFTPSAVKLFEDTLEITHNATAQTNPIQVTLSGTGVDASVGTADTVEIGVTPQKLEFGSVRMGQTAQRTFTITNQSDSAQLIGTVGVSTGPFVVESGTGAFSLAPGEVRPVNVRFAPTLAQSFNDSLLIVYSGTDVVNTVAVKLSGTGMAPNVPSLPSVSVTPEVTYFGNVRVGESGTRLITVVNTSDSGQIVGSVSGASSGSSFTVDNSGGSFTIAPGEMRQIAVTFTPTSAGIQRDSLMINYGVEGLQPTVVQLIGQGVEVSNGGGQEQIITISPSSVEFGSATIGTTMQRQFTITNPSTTTPLTGVVANPTAPFFVQGAGAGAFTIAPGESRTINVSYTPTFAGTFSDNLMINYASGATVGTSFVRLSGNATAVVSGVDADERRMTGTIASYPEPTTAGASVRFSTATSGAVRLAVFDAQGREVARLVDGTLGAGDHVVTWSAENQPAGVYHVQLMTGTGMSTGRITIVK